jgi:hypothetical protein
MDIPTEAEKVIRNWQRDCQPMACPSDLEELEKRLAAFGTKLMAAANEGRKPGHFCDELVDKL